MLRRFFLLPVAGLVIALTFINSLGKLPAEWVAVVGLGKTLMATALAKVFQDDHFCYLQLLLHL